MMKPFAIQMREFDDRRLLARVTDEELAREAEVSSATISRYRMGRQVATVDTWVALHNALERLIAKRAEALALEDAD